MIPPPIKLPKIPSSILSTLAVVFLPLDLLALSGLIFTHPDCYVRTVCTLLLFGSLLIFVLIYCYFVFWLDNHNALWHNPYVAVEKEIDAYIAYILYHFELLKHNQMANDNLEEN